jgi:hypothetical protein
VDDAPISGEESSLGRRYDVTHGGDTVLERHDFRAAKRVPRRRMRTGGGGLHNQIEPLASP